MTIRTVARPDVNHAMLHRFSMDQQKVLPSLPRMAAVAMFVCGLLAVYFTTVRSLFDRWSQSGSEYSHGPLLVGVIAWLLFRDRQRLLLAETRTCYWALVPAILISLLWSAAYITQVNIVQQIALPGVLFFGVTALLGISTARIILFPLFLIVFALPFWNVLQPPLQAIATTACAAILSILSIPAHINGNFITLTSGMFQIATGCSGLNLFLAASVLGILFAHLNFTARRHQIIVVLFAVLVGIVCNWVRIITIILVAQFSDNIQHPIVQDHDWLGWVWFAVLFAGYLIVVNRLPFATAGAATKTAQHGKPLGPRRISVPVLLICMLSVYSLPLLSVYLLNKPSFNSSLLPAPVTVLGYPAQNIVTADAWQPNFHGASSELHLRLATNPAAIDFHLYFYATQRQGSELVHFDNTLTDNDRWRLVRYVHQGSTSLTTRWQDAIVQTGNPAEELLLVRYWYAIAGSNTTSARMAKILQLKGFINKRTDAALVALSSSCAREDCTSAQQLLDNIAAHATQEAAAIVDNMRLQRSKAQ